MKKNLRAISIFSGCVSASVVLMILAALTPKQNIYSPVTLKDKQDITLTTKKTQSNYTFLALILLSGSIPLSIMSNLVVSNRLPEVELEAEEYNKQRMLRKIKRDSELQTERELCNANRTVTVTAHEKNLESAFIELAEASDWHINSEDESDYSQVPLPMLEDEKKNLLA